MCAVSYVRIISHHLGWGLLQISSIRVRILNPDGSLVDESTLQDDNTVFLSVIRQSTSDRIQEALQETKKQ